MHLKKSELFFYNDYTDRKEERRPEE